MSVAQEMVVGEGFNAPVKAALVGQMVANWEDAMVLHLAFCGSVDM